MKPREAVHDVYAVADQGHLAGGKLVLLQADRLADACLARTVVDIYLINLEGSALTKIIHPRTSRPGS